jgi:hydrogenase 3 maturation protease
MGMPSRKDLLKSKVKGEVAVKETITTVWCLGNTLRGDDGVGVRCGELLLENPVSHLEVVLCETVPENFAAPLRRTPPEKLIIIDACVMGTAPGSIRLLDPENLDGLTETTHGLPLGEILKEILPRERIVVIGIEPKDTGLSLTLSAEVESAARKLARALRNGEWARLPGPSS